MDAKWFNRIFQAAAITLVLVAICEELEKPPEERRWHGKIAGLIPYDFRMPTMERIKDTYWNPHGWVLTPQVIGVGWTINFHALLENLGVLKTVASEENFLMPTQSIKEVMKQVQEAEPE